MSKKMKTAGASKSVSAGSSKKAAKKIFRKKKTGNKKEVTKAMGVNDFSEASVNILMSHYKVQDQDILRNTALAL